MCCGLCFAPKKVTTTIMSNTNKANITPEVDLSKNTPTMKPDEWRGSYLFLFNDLLIETKICSYLKDTFDNNTTQEQYNNVFKKLYALTSVKELIDFKFEIVNGITLDRNITLSSSKLDLVPKRKTDIEKALLLKSIQSGRIDDKAFETQINNSGNNENKVEERMELCVKTQKGTYCYALEERSSIDVWVSILTLCIQRCKPIAKEKTESKVLIGNRSRYSIEPAGISKLSDQN